MQDLARPKFECKCCGLCCKRDPYYAVSLLDIERISDGLELRPIEFFGRYCSVIMTPGGFRYSAIMAPEGCPFLKDKLCGIHHIKPIGCWVFPESSLLSVTQLKRSVTAIPTCAILDMPDSDMPLETDYTLMAERDLHFECTKAYFKEHEDFDGPSWAEATSNLRKMLLDTKALYKKSEEIQRNTHTKNKPLEEE
jgi:Fe-S-cluster containining protein